MDVLGTYIRPDGERYIAGVASVTDGSLESTWSLPAPTGTDLGAQLDELYRFLRDRIEQSGAERLALLSVDVPRGKAAPKRVTRRAEGAILAAAGAAGVPVDLWSDGQLRGHAGQSTQNAVDNLCATLTGVPAPDELRRAAAVAVACSQCPDRVRK